jgi:hypothetical protein
MPEEFLKLLPEWQGWMSVPQPT